MNTNLRTAALIAAGIVSAASVADAEEAKMNPVETAVASTSISGYVSTSALFNLGEDEGGTSLPGRSFDGPSKINQINLDVVKLSIENPVGEGDWSAGYKVDLLFGPDANTLATTSTLGENNSDFGVKQAYVVLQTPLGNDLTTKIGVFDTIIGYEVFESGNNPNFSRSYAYYIEPTQHTGILLSYALNDWLTLNAGLADAWNARINAPGADSGDSREFGLQAYMGSVAITIPEGSGFLEKTLIFGGIVHGLTSVEGGDGDPRTSLYGGLTIPTPLEKLAVGLAYDYRMSERYRAGMDNASEYATTMAAYVTFQMTEQARLGLRGEYATGSAGTWSYLYTDTAGNAVYAKPPGGPDKEEYFGLTATLDYNLWANVLTRLEFRWDTDMADGRDSFGGLDDPDQNAYIIGLNVLYKF